MNYTILHCIFISRAVIFFLVKNPRKTNQDLFEISRRVVKKRLDFFQTKSNLFSLIFISNQPTLISNVMGRHFFPYLSVYRAICQHLSSPYQNELLTGTSNGYVEFTVDHDALDADGL